MSEKGLQILARKNRIPDVKGQLLESCTEYCLAGKQHAVSFQKSNKPKRRKHVLDLVYSEICSMSEKSLRCVYYFVTFIDDHSRRIRIYLLNTKR